MPFFAYAKASVSLSCSTKSVTVGEAFRVTLTLKGDIGGDVKILQYSQARGVQINWNNSSRSNNTSIINGVVSKEMGFSFEAVARQVGTHRISPIILEMGGKRYTTNQTQIHVTKRQQSNFYVAQSSLSNNQCYYGQTVVLNIDFMIAEQEIKRYQSYVRKNYELANVHYGPLTIPETLKKNFNVKPVKYRAANNNNDLIFGEEIQGRKLNGFFYRVHRISLELDPKSTGSITIPSMPISFYKAKVSRGFFGNQIQADTPLGGQTQALRLTVLDVPGSNKPEGYQGIISDLVDLKLKVLDLTPGQKVQLHSPIAIELEVHSKSVKSKLHAPDFNLQPKLLEGFNVSYESMTREETDFGIRFKEIIIRPKTPELKEVPSLSLPYFSSKQSKYIHALSKPFALSVEKVSVDDQLNEESPLAMLQNQDKIEIKKEEKVEGLETNLERLNANWKDGFSVVSFLSLSLLPWISSILVFVMIALGNASKNSKANQAYGYNDSLNRIVQSSSSSEILDTLSKYINKTFNVTDPASIKLKNEDLQKELKSLLENLEAASYAAASQSNNDSMKNQTQAIIKSIQKELS